MVTLLQRYPNLVFSTLLQTVKPEELVDIKFQEDTARWNRSKPWKHRGIAWALFKSPEAALDACRACHRDTMEERYVEACVETVNPKRRKRHCKNVVLHSHCDCFNLPVEIRWHAN